MELPWISFKPEKEQLPVGIPLVMLHGLTGSKESWEFLPQQLANETNRQVFAFDARNHGDTPHTDSIADNCLMVKDILKTLESLGLSEIHLLGHSMGGRTAMLLSLTKPEMVKSVIVEDIAPVPTMSLQRFKTYFQTLKRFNLKLDGKSLEEKKSAISASYPDGGDMLKFSLHSLVIDPNEPDSVRWRFNSSSLEEHIEHVLGWPKDQLEGKQYRGPSCFIGGETSIYTSNGTFVHENEIKGYFPSAELHVIPDAGHWVHSDKPELFIKTVTIFFKNNIM